MKFKVGDRVKAPLFNWNDITITKIRCLPPRIEGIDKNYGVGLFDEKELEYFSENEKDLEYEKKSVLPTEAAERKKYPIATGFIDYFSAAIAEISHVSYKGNEQHNPGQPLHWARNKSADQADTIMRHFLERGTIDPVDGIRHSAKLAWRALALLQLELEAEGYPIARGASYEEKK
jgi:hypothetical protein